MDMGIGHVDLAKPGDAMLNPSPAEHAESAVVLDRAIEGDFGAGQQTTAISGRSIAVKPRVIDFTKSVETSLSAT